MARVRQGRIDAIILDLDLPDSSGLTTFLRIQPKATRLPIVVLVDETDEELGRDAVTRGALDYLDRELITPQVVEKVLRYATERTHTLLALKASEQRYRELFQNVTAGVFQTTPDGKFMAANPALVRMLGYDSEDELIELDVARDVYMDPDHRQNWARTMAEGGEVRNAELLLKRKDGTRIVVLENSRAVRDDDGKVLFYEGTLTDITAAHELSQQLSYDASHDPLTGPRQPPRVRAEAAARARADARDRQTHAVCYMDLDRFKTVNDTCGHVAGDELLRQLGHVLQQKVRSADIVARLGGDEFAVLLHNCGLNDALQVANNLLKAVQQFEFIWGANKFMLGASIGVVGHPRRLQAHRAGDERRRHRLLCGQGRRAQPRARLPGRRGPPRATARRDGLGGARQARARGEPPVPRGAAHRAARARDGREAALRAAGAHARRVRPHGAARRVPARRRALQPLRALRPLGHRRGARLDPRAPRRARPRVALLHQSLARLDHGPGHRRVRPAGGGRLRASTRPGSASRRRSPSRSAISARRTS